MRANARNAMGAALALAYVGVSYWLMTSAPDSPWNAVALLAPMLVLIGFFAWRARRRGAAALALAVLAGLAMNAVLGRSVAQRSLFLGQHVVIHLFLAALFGVTLRRGAQALISAVALRVHGQLTPAMARYSRNVTWAWTLYFTAMAVLSIALFTWASFEAWALFANWLTPLAVAAMFGGEHWLRYRLHPEFERVTMLRAIQAYSQRPGAAAEPTPLRGAGKLAEPS